MKNSLAKTGLSLSQAQSVSNLCNQKAKEIERMIAGINNASKIVTIGGEKYDVVVGKPIPKDIVALLSEKAKLHATQAFLMENIKAKDVLLREIKMRQFTTDLKEPEEPAYEEYTLLKAVGEDWGMDQLTISEANELLEAEAYAAHIGQFIHKDGTLSRLRTELPTISTLDFITITDGTRTPVRVTTHHTPEALYNLHEELASLHRNYESRVNYFKAKIKNLVTLENARIANTNADEMARVNAVNDTLRREYDSKMKEYVGEIKKLTQQFEAIRQEEIKTVAAMRIQVDKRFKDIVDMFMDIEGAKEEGKN